MKAVVASSRLGSASSSHSSIQENQKVSQEPSPIQDDSKAVEDVTKEKVKKDGAQLASEMAEVELMKIWAPEDQDADTNDAEANMVVPESLEDGIEEADQEEEESPTEELLNIMEEEEEDPEEGQEEPVLDFGDEQNDVVLPEH